VATSHWKSALCRVSPLLFPVFMAHAAHAQQRGVPSPATLSLDEAIALARQNNPVFLQTKNDEADAYWAVKEAYGQFVPSAAVGTDFSYQASGTPRFGFFTGSDLGISRTPA
jgi:hypothetical protein